MTPRGFQAVTFNVARRRCSSTVRKSVHFSIFQLLSVAVRSFSCLLLPRNTLPSFPYGQNLTTTVSSIISCVLAGAFECSETELADRNIHSAFINIFHNL